MMLNDIIWTFIIPIICIFSLLTNICNIIVFKKLKSINKNYNLFYIKSIINSLYLFSSLFVFVTRCGIFCSSLKDSYMSKFYTIYILYYFTSSLGMLDLLIEVIISLKRYLKLKKSRLVENFPHEKLIISISFLFSFLHFSPILVSYKIVEIKSISKCDFIKYDFQIRDEFKYLIYLDQISWSVVRVALLISLSVLVKILIFHKFKKTAKELRRKSLEKLVINSRKYILHKNFCYFIKL
jgi:hypothetical protein